MEPCSIQLSVEPCPHVERGCGRVKGSHLSSCGVCNCDSLCHQGGACLPPLSGRSAVDVCQREGGREGGLTYCDPQISWAPSLAPFSTALIWKGLVTEHSVPMHHAFGMSSLTTSRVLIMCKTSRNSWKHCYFERSLIDYMDHDNCPITLKCFWTL